MAVPTRTLGVRAVLDATDFLSGSAEARQAFDQLVNAIKVGGVDAGAAVDLLESMMEGLQTAINNPEQAAGIFASLNQQTRELASNTGLSAAGVKILNSEILQLQAAVNKTELGRLELEARKVAEATAAMGPPLKQTSDYLTLSEASAALATESFKKLEEQELDGIKTSTAGGAAEDIFAKGITATAAAAELSTFSFKKLEDQKLEGIKISEDGTASADAFAESVTLEASAAELASFSFKDLEEQKLDGITISSEGKVAEDAFADSINLEAAAATIASESFKNLADQKLGGIGVTEDSLAADDAFAGGLSLEATAAEVAANSFRDLANQKLNELGATTEAEEAELAFTNGLTAETVAANLADASFKDLTNQKLNEWSVTTEAEEAELAFVNGLTAQAAAAELASASFKDLNPTIDNSGKSLGMLGKNLSEVRPLMAFFAARLAYEFGTTIGDSIVKLNLGFNTLNLTTAQVSQAWENSRNNGTKFEEELGNMSAALGKQQVESQKLVDVSALVAAGMIKQGDSVDENIRHLDLYDVSQGRVIASGSLLQTSLGNMSKAGVTDLHDLGEASLTVSSIIEGAFKRSLQEGTNWSIGSAKVIEDVKKQLILYGLDETAAIHMAEEAQKHFAETISGALKKEEDARLAQGTSIKVLGEDIAKLGGDYEKETQFVETHRKSLNALAMQILETGEVTGILSDAEKAEIQYKQDQIDADEKALAEIDKKITHANRAIDIGNQSIAEIQKETDANVKLAKESGATSATIDLYVKAQNDKIAAIKATQIPMEALVAQLQFQQGAEGKTAEGIKQAKEALDQFTQGLLLQSHSWDDLDPKIKKFLADAVGLTAAINGIKTAQQLLGISTTEFGHSLELVGGASKKNDDIIINAGKNVADFAAKQRDAIDALKHDGIAKDDNSKSTNDLTEKQKALAGWVVKIGEAALAAGITWNQLTDAQKANLIASEGQVAQNQRSVASLKEFGAAHLAVIGNVDNLRDATEQFLNNVLPRLGKGFAEDSITIGSEKKAIEDLVLAYKLLGQSVPAPIAAMNDELNKAAIASAKLKQEMTNDSVIKNYVAGIAAGTITTSQLSTALEHASGTFTDYYRRLEEASRYLLEASKQTTDLADKQTLAAAAADLHKKAQDALAASTKNSMGIQDSDTKSLEALAAAQDLVGQKARYAAAGNDALANAVLAQHSNVAALDGALSATAQNWDLWSGVTKKTLTLTDEQSAAIEKLMSRLDAATQFQLRHFIAEILAGNIAQSDGIKTIDALIKGYEQVGLVATFATDGGLKKLEDILKSIGASTAEVAKTTNDLAAANNNAVTSFTKLGQSVDDFNTKIGDSRFRNTVAGVTSQIAKITTLINAGV